MLNESQGRRPPRYRWPDIWTQPGIDGLVFAVGLKALLDDDDPDGRWLRHVRAVMMADKRPGRSGLQAKKIA